MRFGDGFRSVLLGFLVLAFVVTTCVSLIVVALIYRTFHIEVDPDRITDPVWFMVLAAAIGMLFAATRFSFGYTVSFYLYAEVIGFVWLSYFTNFEYNHELARISALASLLALMLPSLFIRSGFPRGLSLPRDKLDWLLHGILLLSAATLLISSLYGFSVPDNFEAMYWLREDLAYPAALRYLQASCVSAFLPFAIACFVEQRRWIFAAVAIAASLLFYPLLLSKLALFASVWLVFLAVIVRFVPARFATILSLLAPALVGLIAVIVTTAGTEAMYLFGLVNFRMLAIPASVIDHYNDFFAHEPLTYFCQISWLKPFVSCPYKEQLGEVLSEIYFVGTLNASMVATEGIASLGIFGAPFSLFVCGLLIALGNRVSEGLPERFVLVSSGVILQVLMNVGLTTSLLTHGLGALFILWKIMPRDFAD